MVQNYCPSINVAFRIFRKAEFKKMLEARYRYRRQVLTFSHIYPPPPPPQIIEVFIDAWPRTYRLKPDILIVQGLYIYRTVLNATSRPVNNPKDCVSSCSCQHYSDRHMCSYACYSPQYHIAILYTPLFTSSKLL
jgi:hypothetical protein